MPPAISLTLGLDFTDYYFFMEYMIYVFLALCTANKNALKILSATEVICNANNTTVNNNYYKAVWHYLLKLKTIYINADSKLHELPLTFGNH